MPNPMDHHEKMRIRAAAFKATRIYPGPVGEVLSRELLAWEEFGYRLDKSGSVLRLVDVITKTSIPTPTTVLHTNPEKESSNEGTVGKHRFYPHRTG